MRCCPLAIYFFMCVPRKLHTVQGGHQRRVRLLHTHTHHQEDHQVKKNEIFQHLTQDSAKIWSKWEGRMKQLDLRQSHILKLNLEFSTKGFFFLCKMSNKILFLGIQKGVKVKVTLSSLGGFFLSTQTFYKVSG